MSTYDMDFFIIILICEERSFKQLNATGRGLFCDEV